MLNNNRKMPLKGLKGLSADGLSGWLLGDLSSDPFVTILFSSVLYGCD
jgi:hypothetical protein